MSETLEQTVPTDAAGSRLDKWLIQQEAITISRSMLQSLMEQGAVLVNDQPVAKNYKVKAQDKVAVTIPEPVSLSLEPENIPLDIVYEDDDLLVVNKPKGMVVHPAPGNLTGTLVHALLYHCGDRLSSINGVIRPGIVHRIDKNTSGLLMVAKTDFAHHALSAQIQAHTFTREYQAICIGHLKEASGTICAPIGRHPVDRKKMCVTQQHASHYALYGTGRISRLQPFAAAAGDWKNASNSSTHGICGTSTFGRRCIWDSGQRLGGTVSACRKDWIRASRYRCLHGI